MAVPPLVHASTGSSTPSVVVNGTEVPLWTGVPLCSTTVAVRVASPSIDRMVRFVELVVEMVHGRFGRG